MYHSVNDMLEIVFSQNNTQAPHPHWKQWQYELNLTWFNPDIIWKEIPVRNLFKTFRCLKYFVHPGADDPKKRYAGRPPASGSRQLLSPTSN